jgi:hypothetical protein
VDQVEYHLKLVINLWCGAAPSQYTVDSQLRDIWGPQVPGLDYDIHGVPRLMQQIYQDPLFGPCPSAHAMTPGELITGGGLQTFSSVYMQLFPCANNTPLAAAVLPLKAVPSGKKSAKAIAAKNSTAKKPKSKKSPEGGR